jgi:hypothetical protein
LVAVDTSKRWPVETLIAVTRRPESDAALPAARTVPAIVPVGLSGADPVSITGPRGMHEATANSTRSAKPIRLRIV